MNYGTRVQIILSVGCVEDIPMKSDRRYIHAYDASASRIYRCRRYIFLIIFLS
jgi:hypothetical protein